MQQVERRHKWTCLPVARAWGAPVPAPDVPGAIDAYTGRSWHDLSPRLRAAVAEVETVAQWPPGVTEALIGLVVQEEYGLSARGIGMRSLRSA
jgi:hypothetical protein